MRNLVVFSCIVLFAAAPKLCWAAPASTDFHSLYSIPDTQVLAMNQWQSGQMDNAALMALTRAYVLAAYEKKAPDSTVTKLPGLPPYPVHISIRRNGQYFSEGVAMAGASLSENIQSAIRRSIQLHRAISENSNTNLLPQDFKNDLGIELTVFHSLEKIEKQTFTSLTRTVNRGVDGLLLRHNGRIAIFSPSKPIIHNYSTKKLLARLSEATGGGADAYLDKQSRLYRSRSHHLVQARPGDPVHHLIRGNKEIYLRDINEQRLERFSEQMSDWLFSMVNHDGRMKYKYMPSRGTYSRSNNMIRQWMATLALAEAADTASSQVVSKNVRYNLEHYYQQEGDLGFIEFNNKAKLGAMAIAALAVQANAKNHSDLPPEYHKLINTIWHLRQTDGSFRTFLKPASRNDNQSFYSGEAMLALARAPTLSQRPDDIDKLQKSMEYYMPYYRSTNRYTPFIPWHTMAYWELYQITGKQNYLDAIFELNDWLLNIQDLDQNSAPDMRGRFYVDVYSANGPPHASSTAVYVEGLAYAYHAAVQAGQQARSQAYLTAMKWGVRSLMQLQFNSDTAFYLRHKSKVVGGLRTTVHDNQLRIDNTQHALMALLAVKRFVGFSTLVQAPNENSEFRQNVMAHYSSTARDGLVTVESGPGDAVLLLGGDTQLGRFTQTWAEKYGYSHAFSGIRSELDGADGLLVNLECVVATQGVKSDKKGSKVWHLRADPHMLQVFPKELINIVSVANNHSMDYGQSALRQMTKELLPAAGIYFAGAGDTLDEASAPTIVKINGINIAVYSSTTIEPEFGATAREAGYHWVPENNLKSFETIMRARLQRYKDSAQVHIFSVHWGTNYAKEISLEQKNMAKKTIDIGFDMVVGTHSHLMHGIEIYKGKPIFYDLGNFLVDFKFQGWDDKSIMPKVRLSEQGVTSIELVPITLRNKQVRIAAGSEAKQILDRIAAISKTYGTSISTIKNRGFVVITTPQTQRRSVP